MMSEVKIQAQVQVQRIFQLFEATKFAPVVSCNWVNNVLIVHLGSLVNWLYFRINVICHFY